MPDSYDVVVVGARCAGAPLAMLLAREGLRVCLIDRARFPSEVPSTHAIQPNGVAALERMGLAERVRAIGAPPITQAKIDIDGVVIDYSDGFVAQSGAPMWCIRRASLDQQLVEAAVDAGAEFRPTTAATGLVRNDGRVGGVETPAGRISASLVVGADGPHSGVARMAGSREYHASPPGRLFVWGYFDGVRNPPARLWIGKAGDVGMLAAPTDGELFLVALVPSLADKARYLSDTAAALTEGLGGFPEVADVVDGAGLVGPVRAMARWHGYFREATGPGWVLVGDAGHFKDPTPGQGISDAFRQVEHLVPAITAGLTDGTVDQRLNAWAEWRDEDAWEMYWFAGDMGAPGPTPALVREMIRQVVERPGGADRFLQLMDHQLPPSQLFTPRRALAAAARLAATRQTGVRRIGAELKQVMAQERSRRRVRRQPTYRALEHVAPEDSALPGAMSTA
ncbi:MAG TPA: NAD(P)/FAD-dependent oxidoreductase [Acidimicrobiales bacterium]|nr:NAD(P)/FAD-dependent oxidoreductase [Acidimicrobiales bacterium]